MIDVTVEGTDAVLVHDAHTASPTTAFALSRLADADTLHPSPTFGVDTPTPIGVLRDVRRPVYDTLMAEQLEKAVIQHGKGDLGALLAGNDTWTVV
ncbi:hypothetical protein GCM10023079_55260 [Streptomyces chitinivorans]